MRIQGCWSQPTHTIHRSLSSCGPNGGPELLHSLLALDTCNQQFSLPPTIITHCLKLGVEHPGIGPVHYSRQSKVLYSRLFWRALKLANWSKNVIGEFLFGKYLCTARDHVAHYYAHVTLARASRVFGGINLVKFAKLYSRKSFRLYGSLKRGWVLGWKMFWE